MRYDGRDGWKPPPTMVSKALEALKGTGARAWERRIAAFDRDLKHRPSFTAEVGAWFRAGREDLLHVLLHAFPDSMPLSRESGMPGTPTPQEVTDQRGVVDYSLDRG